MDASKRKLSEPPAEFAVVQFGRDGNAIACVLWNVKAVMNCVGCAGRDQMDINDGTFSPGIAFIDGITVIVNQQRAIELRARVNGTIAVIFSARSTAPENSAAVFIFGLKLQP